MSLRGLNGGDRIQSIEGLHIRKAPLAVWISSREHVLSVLALMLITLLAAAFRLYRLGQWSFWVDELITLDSSLSALETFRLFPLSPLSNLLSHFSLLYFGESEWSARFVPALIGALSIPILYVPLSEMLGRGTARIAALLLAFSPWHLYWSQNARFYTALALFYSLALFTFYLAVERNRLGLMLASLALLYLAVGERFLALQYLPVVFAYLALLKIFPFGRPPGLRRWLLLPLALALFASLLIALADLLAFSLAGNSYLISHFDWILEGSRHSPARLFLTTILAISLPLALLSIAGGISLLRNRERAGLFLLVGTLVPLIGTVGASTIVFTTDRYIFQTLPCWAALGGAAIRAIWVRTGRDGRLFAAAVLLALLAQFSVDNLFYFTVNTGNRYDLKHAYALIQDRQQPGDRVVSTRSPLGEYYLGQEVERYTEVQPDEVTSDRRFWFVIDAENAWDNPELKTWVEQNAALVYFQYLRLPRDLHLRIYLYDPS